MSGAGIFTGFTTGLPYFGGFDRVSALVNGCGRERQEEDLVVVRQSVHLCDDGSICGDGMCNNEKWPLGNDQLSWIDVCSRS